MKRDFIGPNVTGVIMALALVASFSCGIKAADYDHTVPYLPLSTYDFSHPAIQKPFLDRGIIYNESSMVSGSGEISVKGSFHNRAVDSSGWMKGSGSISYESLRGMNEMGKKVDFDQKSDLVFVGQLKNRKRVGLPLFEKGIGASVTEWYNFSHVDKSEMNVVRSSSRFNNTMIYNTALAFEGIWDIKNMRGWSIAMNRNEEYYSGSYQAQKKIMFEDSGK